MGRHTSKFGHISDISGNISCTNDHIVVLVMGVLGICVLGIGVLGIDELAEGQIPLLLWQLLVLGLPLLPVDKFDYD